jgi:hypothetical protein
VNTIAIVQGNFSTTEIDVTNVVVVGIFLYISTNGSKSDIELSAILLANVRHPLCVNIFRPYLNLRRKLQSGHSYGRSKAITKKTKHCKKADYTPMMGTHFE